MSLKRSCYHGSGEGKAQAQTPKKRKTEGEEEGCKSTGAAAANGKQHPPIPKEESSRVWWGGVTGLQGGEMFQDYKQKKRKFDWEQFLPQGKDKLKAQCSLQVTRTDGSKTKKLRRRPGLDD